MCPPFFASTAQSPNRVRCPVYYTHKPPVTGRFLYALRYEMPQRSLRQCGYVGCRELTRQRYCPEHDALMATEQASKEKARDHLYQQNRDNPYKHLYNYRWQQSSAAFLKHNPLCVICRSKGRIRASEVTDHIKPHKGDLTLFWDVDNWQAACKQCHDKKTRQEDGRGRQKQHPGGVVNV